MMKRVARHVGILAVLAAPAGAAAAPAASAPAAPAKPAKPAAPAPAARPGAPAAKPAAAAPAVAPTAKPPAAPAVAPTAKPAVAPTATPLLPAAPARPAAAPIQPEARMRGIDGDILRGAGSVIEPTAIRPADKAEEDFGARSRMTFDDGEAPTRAPTPAAAVGPRVAFETMLGRLEAVAIAKNKKASGRIKLSFTVSSLGKPGDIVVAGFDPKVDAALEKALAGEVIPALAGQTIETSLGFRNGTAARPAAP